MVALSVAFYARLSVGSRQVVEIFNILNEIREAYYKSGTGLTKGGYKGVEDEERVKMQLLKDMTECMMNEKGIRTIDVAESASKEVIRRVDDWESEHFGPEDVVVLYEK